MSIIDLFIKSFNFTENIKELFDLVCIVLWFVVKFIAILLAFLLPIVITYLLILAVLFILPKIVEKYKSKRNKK